MEREDVTCPSVYIKNMGKLLHGLLDSGSQVSLLQKAYYDKYLAPLLGPAKGELVETHNLFSLTVASDKS